VQHPHVGLLNNSWISRLCK